jgi:magnesium-transporting ATPase (P-type)
VDPRTNPFLLAAMALSAAFIVATVLVPPLRTIFATTVLTVQEWGIAMAFSLIPFAAYEVWKLVRRVLLHRA